MWSRRRQIQGQQDRVEFTRRMLLVDRRFLSDRVLRVSVVNQRRTYLVNGVALGKCRRTGGRSVQRGIGLREEVVGSVGREQLSKRVRRRREGVGSQRIVRKQRCV